MAKNVDILEVGTRTVLELDAEEVADIRRRPTAEFDRNGRGVVSCIKKRELRGSNWCGG